MKAVATVASAHVGAYSSDLPLLLELDDGEEEEEVDSLAPMVSLSVSPSLCLCARGTTELTPPPSPPPRLFHWHDQSTWNTIYDFRPRILSGCGMRTLQIEIQLHRDHQAIHDSTSVLNYELGDPTAG